MKKSIIALIMIMAILLITNVVYAMTDNEMQAIMKTSDNWDSFEIELNQYIDNEGIESWDFHDQVNAFLQDDVGPQSETEAFDWWSTDGWYQETQIEWIYPWRLWYMKYKEKYYNAQWA